MRRTTVSAWAACVAAVLGACGSGPVEERDLDTSGTQESPAPTDVVDTTSVPLNEVSGELILTRQRDLLDRGLINVLVHNGSDSSLLLDDIEMSADFFESGPAAPRTISVRSGRDVAIQVPYGKAVDCDARGRIAADLTFTARRDDAAPRRGHIRLDGTDLLDTIRAEQCAARRFEQETDTWFDATAIVDGEVVTDLVIASSGTSTGLAVTAVSGTVLVAVRAPDAWLGANLDGGTVTIPLTFVVNRCDPHALAEVTKRYGLDVAVSVDGGEPVTVALDVTDLVTDLGTIVEQCSAAAAAGG